MKFDGVKSAHSSYRSNVATAAIDRVSRFTDAARAAFVESSGKLAGVAKMVDKDTTRVASAIARKARAAAETYAQRPSYSAIVRRVLSFSSVGGSIAVIGLVLQFALVRGLGVDKHAAYLVQSIVSIELNFFINNFFTWRDRRVPGFASLGNAWLKFHTVRIFTVTFNQMLYAALLFLGIQYLVANVLCIFIVMVINFWTGDKFIFAGARSPVAFPFAMAAPAAVGQSLATADMRFRPTLTPPANKWLPRRAHMLASPSVSVVIPVKQSERTIEATVASILQQEYIGPVEIILVGDKDDSTWIPLRQYIEDGLVIIVETEVHQARLGLNAKRNAGLQQARGQVLVLTDSDMVLPPDWIASGVEYIRRGWPCVVGSVRNVNTDLPSAYAEAGRYYSDSAAQQEERVVDMERLGTPGYQMPITANLFLSREVLYYVAFPDPNFDAGYENYQWHWEIARADVAILSAPAVVAVKRSRTTWRRLMRQYVDLGKGCADFILAHPQVAFSRRHLDKAIGLIFAVVCLFALLAGMSLQPDWPRLVVSRISHPLAAHVPAQSGMLLLGAYVSGLLALFVYMSFHSVRRIRHANGLWFPVLAMLATFAFTAGVARGSLSVALGTLAARRGAARAGASVEVVNVIRQSISTLPDLLSDTSWSAAGPQVTGMLPALERELRAPAWPSVSVIIPVKRSQATIAAAVESLLQQDYKGDIEILLVGDKHDPTWEPIQRHIDSGRITIIEAEIHSTNRDANAKRSIGLHAAKGTLLALTDSDMVLPTNWVSTGIEYILKGWPCVAGPMRGARGDFWDAYADLVDLGSKTPRFGANVIVDRGRFGQPYHKPPITANVFFTRTVLEKAGDFDPSFTHSYEDYSWFWTVCRAGIPIFCTPELAADHYHRQGWRQLIRQYTRAGRGCGDFVLKYPESPLSQGRLVQLAAVWTTLLALAALMVGGAATALSPSLIRGTPLTRLIPQAPVPIGLLLTLVVIALVIGGLFALGVRNAISVRRPVAVIYPYITSVFAISFSIGLSDILLRAAKRWVVTHRVAIMTGVAFGGVLCTAFILRFWSITIRPGTEWDEPVYANVAWNMSQSGFPFLRPEVGHQTDVYFSQPPFYFALVALWYKLTNTSQALIIGQARLFSALMSVGMVGSLFLLLRRRIGAWALVPTILVAVDSWIVFANRIGWIDNTAIPIGIIGLWAYDRSVAHERRRPFIVAAAILAMAALFKYLAIYFVLAVAINWLITRKQRQDHVVAVIIVGCMIALYAVIFMVAAGAFTKSGQTNLFIAQHLHQLLRVTNRVSSRGNVMTLQQVFAALVSQYRVFVLTVGLCGLAGALLVADVARSIFRRDLTLLRQHSLEASWALSAVLIFCAVQMKFINYFEYVMIPLLIYLAVRTIDVIRPWVAPSIPRGALVRVGLASLLIAIVGLDLVSFTQRIADRSDNTFVSVQTYAAVHIPATAEVLTEQPIGTMIHQPYCQLIHVMKCANPQWIILFVSLTQKPPIDPKLQALLSQSTLMETYQGFKETIYIYQIHPGPPTDGQSLASVQDIRSSMIASRLSTESWRYGRVPADQSASEPDVSTASLPAVVYQTVTR